MQDALRIALIALVAVMVAKAVLPKLPAPVNGIASYL